LKSRDLRKKVAGARELMKDDAPPFPNDVLLVGVVNFEIG
jgi:hypothetical protein